MATPAPPDLGVRFAAAAAHEPLSALAARQSAELEAVLRTARAPEDLPGKWQAALLAAEAAGAGAPASAPGRCCGHHED
jgi:hypothetical protein